MIASLLVLSLGLQLAESWWCTGHMLVADIAFESMCAKTAKRVAQLIDVQAEFYPKSPDFVQTACWADDIKHTTGFYNEWHYIDYPYIPADPPFGNIPAADTHNAVWALTESNKTFHQDNTLELDLSRALYFYIHFMGDLHQPLHAVSLFSSRFDSPDGDIGGNLYTIRGANVTNLHSFWDSGAGQWDDYKRPMTASIRQKFDNLSDGIMGRYPKRTFSNIEGTYDEYARVSTDWARNLSYTTPYDGELSEEYIETARHLCEHQVALAGYRLAATLEVAFGC